MKQHPIAKSIYEYPDKWVVGRYHAYAGAADSAISIWIANGFLFIDVPDASMWDKYQIMKAVKWLRKKKMIEKLKELESL